MTAIVTAADVGCDLGASFSSALAHRVYESSRPTIALCLPTDFLPDVSLTLLVGPWNRWTPAIVV